MLFFIRKAVISLAMPLNFSLFLFFIAFVVLYFTNRKRLSLLIFGFSFVFFYLMAINPVSDMIIAPLENRYLSFVIEDFHLQRPVIIVLGAGGNDRSDISSVSRLIPVGVSRLSEGIRIFKGYDDATLVFTGENVGIDSSIAHLMKEAAITLGVPDDKIVAINKGRTTGEEAVAVVEYFSENHIYAERPLILVTSASHLPRAATLFENVGLCVYHAPADFSTNGSSKVTADDFFPSASTLAKTHRAVHEYLGLMLINLQ